MLSDEQAMAFNENPLDLAEKIALAGFPLLHVVGDDDRAVPVDENTAPFEKFYGYCLQAWRAVPFLKKASGWANYDCFSRTPALRVLLNGKDAKGNLLALVSDT